MNAEFHHNFPQHPPPLMPYIRKIVGSKELTKPLGTKS